MSIQDLISILARWSLGRRRPALLAIAAAALVSLSPLVAGAAPSPAAPKAAPVVTFTTTATPVVYLGEPMPIHVAVHLRGPRSHVLVTLNVSPSGRFYGGSKCVATGNTCVSSTLRVSPQEHRAVTANFRPAEPGEYIIEASVKYSTDPDLEGLEEVYVAPKYVRVEEVPRSICPVVDEGNPAEPGPEARRPPTLGQDPDDRVNHPGLDRLERSVGNYRKLLLILLMVPVAVAIVWWRYDEHRNPSRPFLAILLFLWLVLGAGLTADAYSRWSHLGQEDRADPQLRGAITQVVIYDGFMGLEGTVINTGEDEALWRSDYGRVDDIRLADTHGLTYVLTGVDGELSKTHRIPPKREVHGWWYFRPGKGVCAETGDNPVLDTLEMNHIRFGEKVTFRRGTQEP